MAEAPGRRPARGLSRSRTPREVMANRRFAMLLVFVAIVGVITSLAAWCFLELVHQIQTGVFTDLPKDLGYDHGAPNWWYLVVLAIAGLITAAAITRLPGNGGHTPANGLSTEQLGPEALPGVVLAALASIGLGAVVGPEAPLIALGGGLGILAGTAAAEGPEQQQVVDIVAASSTFAAVSFLFGSPLIAAIILIEAIGHRRLAAEDHPRPGADGGGDRLARLGRDGLLDRPQHQRHLDRGPAAARVRPSRPHRLPLDDPVRRRRRGPGRRRSSPWPGRWWT